MPGRYPAGTAAHKPNRVLGLMHIPPVAATPFAAAHCPRFVSE